MKKLFSFWLIIMTLLSIHLNSYSKHIVVVGTSAAGTAVVKELTAQKFDGKITWIAAQTDAPYKKTQIDSFLEGTKSEKDISIYDTKTLPKNVTLLLGKRVIEIKPNTRTLVLDDGKQVHYDALFLGVGISLHVPEEYKEIAGVFPFNTLSDAKAIKEYIDDHIVNHAVVVGLGITGMEVCDVIAKKGIHVEGVEKNQSLLHHYIPQEASNFLRHHLQDTMSLHLSTKIARIETNHGHVTGVRLDNETFIPCELIIFTTGGSTELPLLTSAGITIKHGGILVDEHLRTHVPDIYAGGDCILVTDLATGTLRRSGKWKEAEEQGKIAAHTMLGQNRTYRGSKFMYGTHFFGLNFQSYGKVQNLPEDFKATQCTDNKTYYHLFIRQNGILRGYVILDTHELADRDLLKKAVEEKMAISDDELKRISAQRTKK
jgi:NAD(P)H-nitrite reductase large subunit